MEPGRGITIRDYLLLGIFSLALYGYSCIGGRVLTQHEARLPQASIEMAESGNSLIPTCGGRPWLERPPLPHWITIGVATLFGVWDQVWVFRIPNALSGMACVLMTGALSSRFFGREIGILSALMLATSYEFVHYAWLAEEDVYLAAAVLCCMMLFVQLEFPAKALPNSGIESFFGNRSMLWWAFYAVMGTSNLVKGLFFAAAMVGLSGGVWLLVSGNSRRILRYLWFWGAVVFAITSLWWVVAVSLEYPEMLEIWLGDVKNRTDGEYSKAPFWLYGQTLAWTLLPWSIPAVVGLVETGKKARTNPGSFERFLWCWSVVPILFLSIPSHKHHHYLVPCLAPWGILAALGGRRLWQSVPSWPIWLRQPGLSALAVGIPSAIVIGLFRAQIPGPSIFPWILAVAIPLTVFAVGTALLDRRGSRSVAVLMTLLVIGYCGAHSFHGLYLDRYRTEAEFLQRAAVQVPLEEPIYLNAEGTILNTFRNLFYLGDRVKVLHNPTFLLDEKISATRIHLISRRDAEVEIGHYGMTEELLTCSYVPRRGSTGSQWVLYRVTLNPNLPRYHNDLRISPLQAMERVKGPYLGDPAKGSIRQVDFLESSHFE